MVVAGILLDWLLHWLAPVLGALPGQSDVPDNMLALLTALKAVVPAL
jgi:hypothetical protein